MAPMWRRSLCYGLAASSYAAALVVLAVNSWMYALTRNSYAAVRSPLRPLPFYRYLIHVGASREQVWVGGLYLSWGLAGGVLVGIVVIAIVLSAPIQGVRSLAARRGLDESLAPART